MSWWLRAHRAGPLAAMLVAFGVVAWASTVRGVAGGRVPSPIRAGVATPLALWFPLGIVVAVCWACAIDEGRSGRSVTVRSNALLLAAFVAAVVSSAVLALVPMALDVPTLAAAVARNVVGLTGIALVLRRWAGGSAAAALTAGYLALAASLGAQPGGGATWWAFPVADRLRPGDAAIAALVFLAGMAALPTAPKGHKVRGRR